MRVCRACTHYQLIHHHCKTYIFKHNKVFIHSILYYRITVIIGTTEPQLLSTCLYRNSLDRYPSSKFFSSWRKDENTFINTPGQGLWFCALGLYSSLLHWIAHESVTVDIKRDLIRFVHTSRGSLNQQFVIKSYIIVWAFTIFVISTLYLALNFYFINFGLLCNIILLWNYVTYTFKRYKYCLNVQLILYNKKKIVS